MSRIFLLLGAINGFLAVALGAFGAHAIQPHLTERLYTVYQTGIHYHGIHALSLLLVGIIAAQHSSRWIQASGWLLMAGIILFSGSLYALALTGIRGLGAITPIGGLAFLLGWLTLCVAIWQMKPVKNKTHRD